MNELKQLEELAARGMQPRGGMVWLGLGVTPKKRNALVIDPDNLPAESQCSALAGLDVVLSFHGYATRYGTLRRLCGAIYTARPRRLIILDLDFRKLAFLKLGGC